MHDFATPPQCAHDARSMMMGIEEKRCIEKPKGYALIDKDDNDDDDDNNVRRRRRDKSHFEYNS
jgi:hypothetical protein